MVDIPGSHPPSKTWTPNLLSEDFPRGICKFQKKPVTRIRYRTTTIFLTDGDLYINLLYLFNQAKKPVIYLYKFSKAFCSLLCLNFGFDLDMG